MDLVKLMLLNLGIFAVLALAATRSDAALFDMSEHSGIIRGSDGNYTRISENGAMRSLTNNQTLSLLEKPVINTSKGNFPVEIQRSVPVDINRVGKAVSGFAKKVGPLSMALAAADLICELTTICSDGNNWLYGQQTNLITEPANCSTITGTTVFTKLVGNSYYDFKKISCGEAVPSGWGFVTSCNCPFGDQIVQKGPYSTLPEPPHVPTASDWSSKESALNDYRFVPHLNDANLDIPALAPSIQNAPVTKEVSKITSTNRDANGNVTGTTETKTEVKISDGTDANAPNSLTVIEQNTVTNYDVNNNVINSTTNVTNPEKPAPQEIKIDFDNTTDTPLKNYSVPSSFAYTSWGSGTCPADRTVSYHYGTLNLTFEPACDFAVAMNPAILAVAGFLAMFIIAGVRNND